MTDIDKITPDEPLEKWTDGVIAEWYDNYKCGACLTLCGHEHQSNEYCRKRKMKMNNWNRACRRLNLGPVKTKKAKQAFKEKKMSEKKEQMRLKIRGKLT